MSFQRGAHHWYYPTLVVCVLLGLMFSASLQGVTPNLLPPPQRLDQGLLSQILVSFKDEATSTERAVIHTLAGGTILWQIKELGIDVVRAAVGAEDQVLNLYRSNEQVRYAEMDRILRTEAVTSPSPTHVPYLARTNDPLFDRQWYLRTTGVPVAWSALPVLPPVRVGVLDTGADLDHPELRGQIFSQINLWAPGYRPLDYVGHGTQVAGIIAAHSNNGLGIAGVAPNAKLIVVKITDNGNNALSSTLADGLIRAVNLGARVVNMSVEVPVSRAVTDAVRYAVKRDVVLVAAAGNGNSSVDFFAGHFPDVIAVGATKRDDRRWELSNYGPKVSLAAPGVEIESLSYGGGYTSGGGTSFAAPQVTGAAALLRGLHPNWSAKTVQKHLCKTADQIPGTGRDWRCGRLNVARAVGTR